MGHNGIVQLINEYPTLTTGLLLLVLIVLVRHSIIVYRRYRYCKQLGHDLNEKCLCRRCRKRVHNYVEVKNTREEEDPGALYLDSNFQPYTYYVIEEYLKCTRCEVKKRYRTYTRV